MLSPHNKVVFFLFLLISLGTHPINAQTQPLDTLKKVKIDSLTSKEASLPDSLQAKSTSTVDSLNMSDGTEESIDEAVTYSADDSVVAMPQKGRALLYGKSKVVFGSMNMSAEYIEIDYFKSLVKAYGKKDSLGKPQGLPTFNDEGQEMSADTIKYNLKTKKGKIYNAWTKQGELLVFGSEIKKDGTNITYFKNMKCVLCNQADSRTVFRATKAKVIPNDKIVTGPMYLEIGGVPTPIGLPFGYFPNTKKQHSGILLPTYGNSPGLGYSLRQGGFYWGINDKTDMIIRGDIYSNGSYALTTTNSYNVLYKASGMLTLGMSQITTGDKDIPKSLQKNKSYQIGWTHNQDNKSNPSIRFNANVNYKNNQNYNSLTSVNTGQLLQSTFLSNINFTKTYKLSSLSLNATHSQNTQTQQTNITFPSLTFNVNRFFPFKRENAVKQNVLDKIGMSYLLEAQNTLTGKDSTIFKGRPLDSLHYGIRQSVPISTNFNIFKYITATPQVKFTSYLYTKSIEKEYYSDIVQELYKRRDTVRIGDSTYIKENTYSKDSLVHRVKNNQVNQLAHGYDATFSTAFNTQIYFDYSFKKGRVQRIRHLLIPTLTYSYRPDFGAPKYGFWKTVQTDTIGHTLRYSTFEKSIFGGPTPGKQNMLSLALNNNVEGKFKHKTDTGVTYKKVALIQNLGLSGSYNFAADSFRMSNISATARTKLFKYFDVNANSTFNPYVYNQTSHTTVSKYSYENGGPLARLTNASFQVNTTIGSNMLAALQKSREAPKMSNGAESGTMSDLNPDEKLAWNLSVYYTLDLTNPNNQRLQPTHSLRFNADILPTKFWKVGISSGIDVNHQKLTTTAISVVRDLKCWQASIRWVPFGIAKSYNITLNLKSSMFSEFKIPRQRNFYDNNFL